MFRSIRFSGCALLLACCALPLHAAELPRTAPEQVGLGPDRLARLAAFSDQLVQERKLAGSVTLVARRGKVAFLHTSGKMDLERGTPMREDALFRVWSMTKPITSVALLMLFEEGKFQLSDAAETHIPAFKDLKVAASVDETGKFVLVDQNPKMTVHDLFRHTSGLSYGFYGSLVDKAYEEAGLTGFDPIPLDKVIEALGKAPLSFQPGTKWQYSYAHDVQAWLVQHFSGERFDRFLRTRLFEPLGMQDSSFGLAKEKLDRLTTVYGPKEPAPSFVSFEPLKSGIVATEKPGEGPYLKHADTPAGGTGLISSIGDYWRFAQMLVNGGELDGVRILSRKTVELMTASHTAPGLPGLNNPGEGYGLGVYSVVDIAGAGNLGSRGQFGWAGAANTFVIMDPAEQLVAIFMTQYQPFVVPLMAQFRTLVYASIVD